MSDELDKKIRQIADMLGQENLPENIKGLLSLFTGSAAATGKSLPQAAAQTNSEDSAKEEIGNRNEAVDSMEMLRRMKKIMDRLNLSNDPRVSLLSALKPFMSNQRQKKINNCINILRMASLAKILDEQENEFL